MNLRLILINLIVVGLLIPFPACGESFLEKAAIIAGGFYDGAPHRAMNGVAVKKISEEPLTFEVVNKVEAFGSDRVEFSAMGVCRVRISYSYANKPEYDLYFDFRAANALEAVSDQDMEGHPLFYVLFWGGEGACSPAKLPLCVSEGFQHDYGRNFAIVEKTVAEMRETCPPLNQDKIP